MDFSISIHCIFIKAILKPRVIVIKLHKVPITQVLGNLEAGIPGVNDGTAILEVIAFVKGLSNGSFVKHHNIGTVTVTIFVGGLVLVVDHDDDPARVACIPECVVGVDPVRPSMREDQRSEVTPHRLCLFWV